MENINIQSSINFNDETGKALWAKIMAALQRGETVKAEFKTVNSVFNMQTLGMVAKDEKGQPLFGVTPNTRIDLAIALAVDVPEPTAPVEKPVSKAKALKGPKGPDNG